MDNSFFDQNGNDSEIKQDTFCPKCGELLEPGQNFCPKCGTRLGSRHRKTLGKMPRIIIVMAVIAAAVVAAVIVLPKALPNTSRYLEEADYEKAYKYARDNNEKKEVIFENSAAVESAVIIEDLYDPSSYSLRTGYFLKESNDEKLVLYINGHNRMGATVGGLSYFTRLDADSEWKYVDTINDMEYEEINEYDDDNTVAEKNYHNNSRTAIAEVRDKGIKMSKDGVARINNLFKEGRLDGSIKLLKE